jgi:isopenicillin-N epimerase
MRTTGSHSGGSDAWSVRRSLVALTPDTVNLNAGTLSPTPLPVLEAMFQLRRRLAGNPSDFLWRQTPSLIERARAALASYLNCDAAGLLLLPNITFAMNLVTRSLPLPAGCEVLTTDHEYGAMINCWQQFAAEQRVELRSVTLPYRTEDSAELVDAIAKAITAKTRVLFFSHVNASTGLVMPARELVRLARERGLISVIDGAHAPGNVPVDVRAIGADFYAGNCHKWMMAPASCGFLQVASEHRTMIRPLVTSWGWGYDPHAADEDSGHGGTRWQWDLEFHGTTDRTPQMVLPETIAFRAGQLGGEEALRAGSRELGAYARERLTACGLVAATPQNPQLASAMIAFDVPACDPVEARNRLWQRYRIECPVTQNCSKERHFLRVSCGWFNTSNDIDALADAAAREFST